MTLQIENRTKKEGSRKKKTGQITKEITHEVEKYIKKQTQQDQKESDEETHWMNHDD
jgi:hypothetical protein